MQSTAGGPGSDVRISYPSLILYFVLESHILAVPKFAADVTGKGGKLRLVCCARLKKKKREILQTASSVISAASNL